MALNFEKSGSKYDRLSYIYDRLSRSPDGVTIKELAEEIKVSTKTIQRDLHEALASSGVYCEGRRWKLNRTAAEDGLANEERIVLGVLDSLAKQAGNAFYSKAHQLLEKISCQLDHPLFVNLDSETLSDDHLHTFSMIENAIKEHQLITGVYVSVSKKRRNVRLKPLRLAFFDGYWYLLAYDADDSDIFKKFHLKSFSNISVQEETFEYPKHLSNAIEYAYSVWFSLSEPFEVRLWVEKTIAPYFERKPHYGQSIEGRDPDGSIEVVVKITNEMEIIPLVFWYLPYVHVLEPEWLKEEIREKITTYAKNI